MLSNRWFLQLCFQRYLQRSHIGLRTLLLLFAVATLVLSPAAALAQEAPPTIWIPPYLPYELPAAAPEASIASSHDPYPLIVDTDPGVDDAVALAWLLTNVPDPELNILGIVTVAGNTTVENATKNVYTLLELAGETVPVVMGAKKPWTEKLSSNGKLIHGPDGLWGMPEPTNPGVPLANARDFYCSNARNEPAPTILALGPLTNIAEAIRHCRSDMDNYKRLVILGGAKSGGNTTPVAEFNIWQDPKAAQLVFEYGLETDLVIDVVPLDAYKQLVFTPEELLGAPLDPSNPPLCLPPVVNIFTASPAPVLRSLGYSVCKYAQTQLFAQFGAPNPVANIADFVAAVYTIQGLALDVRPALVEVMERPDSVRGQTIIGLAQAEQLAMVTSDQELDAVADLATEAGVLDPNVQQALFLLSQKIVTNANIVWTIDAAAMRGLFPAVAAAAVEATADADEPRVLDERLYLPSVGVD